MSLALEAPPLRPDARRWEAKATALALALALLVCLSGIWNHSLWTPDEPRVAGVGAEMVRSGDYLVPHLAGEPFLEKPPLTWWAMSASLRLFGISAGSARLPSALCSLLVLLLVFDLASRLADRRAGLIALVVLASSWSFLSYGHRICVDVWLLLWVNVGYWCFARASFARTVPEAPDPAPRPAWLIGTYLAGGLAFLSKGPIGPVLLFGPLGLSILLQRRWSLLRSWWHLSGLLTLCALCALWPALLYLRGGWDLLEAFAVDNLLFRIVDPALIGAGDHDLGHHHPVYYYLTRVPFVLMPWVLLAPAALAGLRRGALPEGWRRADLLFVGSLFPVGLALLSLPSTKRTLYLLPLVPSAAVALGVWLSAQFAPSAQSVRSPSEGPSARPGEDPGDLKPARGWTRRGLLALAAALTLAPLALLGAVLGLYSGLLKLDSWWSPARAALSNGVLAGALALVLSAAALSLVWGVRLVRRGSSPALIRYVLAGHFVFALSYNLCLYRGLEPTKGLERLAQGLDERQAFAPGLASLGLDETAEGAISFYNDRTLRELSLLDGPELQAWFDANPGWNVLVRARAWPALEESLQRRLHPTFRWEFSAKSTYWLCQVRPQ